MKKVAIVVVFILLISVILVACSNNVDSDIKAPSSGEVNKEEIEGDNNSDTGGQDNKDEEQKPVVPKPEDVENEDSDEVEVPTPIVTHDSIVIVTAKKVNIRDRASSSGRVVGTMKQGEGLGIISRDNPSWYKVYFKGKEAYISSSYAKIINIKKSPNTSIENVISVGKTLMGYPYVWGSQRYHFGNGIINRNFKMGEFDCSALTLYAFYKGAGKVIDVTTRSQVLEGNVVRGKIQRGDLMFFTNSARRYKKGIERVGHVAIYLGDNYILHTADKYAVIEEISSSRWDNYLVSKRYF